MHAMQYEITLPADYDMGIIRHRVAAKGHLLDDYPGLGAKAYLVRERGVDDSPVNQYAPFYLWNTPAGMNSFLWGPGFQGIVDDFGRPEVQHWTGLAFAEGIASAAPARAAIRRRMRIPDRTPLGPLAAELAHEAERLARQDGNIYAAVSIDPRTWEALHFSVWDHASPQGVGDVFQVLHLSAPERDLLPRGRQW
ncbi:DUF4865 family protein [Streptomyces sp. NBC_01381]|uniref:DUF4865 family protein n=1 Tax=Streptomyces sp. NBC_01381 TaxID=2903845 RepID=UPI00225A6235|nr:DUF4865 family protein [Streptomyces sp. NBC_01381]MCX4669084.1 DUF4865 family protein [Streptomyces sp. NBC_01381]